MMHACLEAPRSDHVTLPVEEFTSKQGKFAGPNLQASRMNSSASTLTYCWRIRLVQRRQLKRVSEDMDEISVFFHSMVSVLVYIEKY